MKKYLFMLLAFLMMSMTIFTYKQKGIPAQFYDLPNEEEK